MTPKQVDAVCAAAAPALCALKFRELLLRELVGLPTYDQRFARLQFHADKGAGAVTCPGKASGSHLWEIDLGGAHGTGTTKGAAVDSWIRAAVALTEGALGEARPVTPASD